MNNLLMENQFQFCAAHSEEAAQAMSMAACSSNHDFLAEWDSPGNSAYWWESFNGNDTRKQKVVR